MKQADDGFVKNNTGAISNLGGKWKSIDWMKTENEVKRLQIRIAEAARLGKMNKVKVLQRILTRSFSAKLLAVRRVSSSKGSRTPGIDREVWKTPAMKMKSAMELSPVGYKAKPLRRIKIPKKNGKFRKLGIPCMSDRAMQALYLLALEPVGETTADHNSYGFRPKRSCRDAIAQCFLSLSKSYSPRWVLDADIKACFDWIDHDWLLDNIPIEKKILSQWLKSGYIQKGKLFPTKAGTPQGGIISPLLANMALDGMEALVKKHNKRGMKLNFIRYADDFCITAELKETLENIIIPELKTFLGTRGLELSEEKTRIVNIEEGFDFLGQTMRKFRGNKLITQPSKESTRIHLDKVRSTIKLCGGQNAEYLIKKLSPVIRGWSNYHRFVQSGKAYYRCQYLTNGYLMKWAKRSNGSKTPKWLRNHFWGKSRDKRHFSCLSIKDGKPYVRSLFYHPEVGQARYIKIRGSVNPYSKKDKEYFAMRERCSNYTRLESRRILPLVYSA